MPFRGPTEVARGRVRASETLSTGVIEPQGMKKLIVRGDPGIRKNAIINHDGEELVVFALQKQGEYHGPEEPQLWCTVGTEAERETFEKREYVPHWLEVETIDAEALDIIKAKGKLAV